MELIILFFPFLTKLAISDVIKFLDLAKFIDKSNNLETLSNIPPFFIASWIWEIFSNSPVTIPNVLFPNSKLLSITFLKPSEKPCSSIVFFISIIWFSIKSGNAAFNPISMAEFIAFPI